MAAVPPAAKERAPHGGRMRCSGSICRRLASLEAASHGIARRGAFQDRFGQAVTWVMIIQVEVIVLGAAFARGFAEELGRAAAQDVWRGLKHFIAQVFEIRRRPAAGRAPFASTSLTGSSSSRTGFPMTASDSWSREARQRAAISSGMRSSSATQ